MYSQRMLRAKMTSVILRCSGLTCLDDIGLFCCCCCCIFMKFAFYTLNLEAFFPRIPQQVNNNQQVDPNIASALFPTHDASSIFPTSVSSMKELLFFIFKSYYQQAHFIH